MEHGDAISSQWPHSSSETKINDCGLDKATELDMLASRAIVKHCKGGTIYTIIYNNIHASANDVYSNRGPESGYSRSIALSAMFGLEPTSGHLDGSFPPLKHLFTCVFGYLRLEYRVVFAVDLFQLVEFLPNIYSEASCNGSTE